MRRERSLLLFRIARVCDIKFLTNKTANVMEDYEAKILEKAKFLWEEYRYRHELCWKLIFQTTAAVVIILIIPFTQTDITKTIKYWIVCVPLIALALLLFMDSG